MRPPAPKGLYFSGSSLGLSRLTVSARGAEDPIHAKKLEMPMGAIWGCD